MYKWFRRIGVILLLGLWAMAGMQLLATKTEMKEATVAQVFSKIGETERTGVVEYYGQIAEEKKILMLERREEYLREIANELGIYDHIIIYRTYGEDSQTTVLQKEGENADTSLRFVTWREKGKITRQTLLVRISLDSDLEMALRVRRRLKETLDEDMETVRSSAMVSGKYAGKLALEQRNQIADGLLADVDASVVTENRDMQLYTIYGYTPYLKEYVKQGKKMVNVNIAMYYDEVKDQTCVYGAVPVLGVDYSM